MHQLVREQRIQRPLPDVFDFFSRAENLEALTPGFLKFRYLTPLPIEMKVDARIDYALALFGVPIRWRTRITSWEPGRRFTDEQESGPYALWHHEHTFEAAGESTIMRDVVSYREPFGPLGALAHVLFVERTIERIFDFRRDATSRLLESSAVASAPGGRAPVVTSAS